MGYNFQNRHPHPLRKIKDKIYILCYGSLQCFGSGSVWIRIIWSDPDPYQETIDMDPGSVKN